MRTGDPRLRAMVMAAAAQDPSIELEPAEHILRACLEMLEREPQLDAAELARRYVSRDADTDASWVAHLARAAVRAAPEA